MPILATIAWSWITSVGGGIIAKVPWQVWVIIAAVIGVFYYGHVRENRGYDRCHTEVVEATKKETARQVHAAEDSKAEAQSRASESAERARQLEETLNAKQKQVDQLKTAKTICLPDAITRQYAPRRLHGTR
jgi:uncharacterized protein HemX